ncbi:MAG TPA: hypothetical protein VM937_10750 [Burkholderiaceae bacterium]|nr:hypothetical protein [Burkholderiaceae bacterium]
MMSPPLEPSASLRNSLVRPTRLWLLPLLAGALPFVATLLAFSNSVAEGYFPWCNPLLDGCVSISRAARHGLSNYLFRALLLPAAVFQWFVWLLCAAWLRSIGNPPTRWIRVLPVLGLGAAAFLILYGTFLGTEGAWYRWMRRFGIIFYFGFTCILMLIVSDAVRRAKLPMVRYRHAAAVLLTLCMTLPLLGLVNILAPLVLNNAAAVDAFENSTEWWGGLIFTVFFVSLAELWRGTGFAADLRCSVN